MKKWIFLVFATLLVFGGVFGFAHSANAQTIEQFRAQIQAMLAQIQQIQARIAELEDKPQEWCHTFTTNLRFGDNNADVGALRTTLIKEGFPGLEAMGGAWGFDENVASAVVGFQQKYAPAILTPLGLKFGTGFVGPSTRAKLNSLYGCGISRPIPPLPSTIIISPRGGETWFGGSQATVQWRSSGIPETSVISVIELENAFATEAWALVYNTSNDGSETIIVPSLEKPCDCRIAINVVHANGNSQVYRSSGLVRVNPSSITNNEPSIKVSIFVIALNDDGASGKKAGCNDSAFALERSITPTVAPLRAVLELLLSMEDEYIGESGLYNALARQNWKLEDVSLVNGEAIIRLSGTYAGIGVCEDPRLKAQLQETALQFPTVHSVSIFLNGVPLDTVVSGRGE